MHLRSLLVLLLATLSNSISGQTSSDVDKITARLYHISLQRELNVDMQINLTVPKAIATINSGGNWADIPYSDNNAAVWPPSLHLKRLYELSVNYRDKNSSYYNDPALKDKIVRGIRFWISNPPKAQNYWWNAIGAANLLGGIYILMEPELSPQDKSRGIELMKVGVKPDHYDYHGVATGQNLLWIGLAHIYASALSNDLAGLKQAFLSAAKEIVITEQEGIQPDFSFYQHGPQNYAFGYGKGFSATAAQYFYLANQTSFQFPSEKIAVLSKYLLEGQQWMSRYAYLEYTAMGREVSRKFIDRKPLLNALRWMMEVDSAQMSEYRSFYNRLLGEGSEMPLIGNRYFRRSDLMVHHRKDYYFSLKGTSNRISSGESGNGENLKAFYQGNGTFYLIKRGDEYADIFPVLDWRKLPGLLSEQKTSTLPLFLWGKGSSGKTSFVYGLSNNQYGCFGYDYDKDSVLARRSWFMFDKEIVNLVSGASGKSLYQSINQCWLKGEVWTDLKKHSNNTSRIFHDSVGYCINTNSPLSLKTDKQSGSWQEINTSASAERINREVFSLGINLGENVKNASYSYTLLPGMSLNEFKNYQLTNHVKILSNTSSIQAVYQKDLQQVQAVFYAAGTIGLPWKELKLTVKKPGLAMISFHNNKLIVNYGTPKAEKQQELTVDRKILLNNADVEIRRR